MPAIDPLYAPTQNMVTVFSIIVAIIVIFILFKIYQLSKRNK